MKKRSDFDLIFYKSGTKFYQRPIADFKQKPNNKLSSFEILNSSNDGKIISRLMTLCELLSRLRKLAKTPLSPGLEDGIKI